MQHDTHPKSEAKPGGLRRMLPFLKGSEMLLLLALATSVLGTVFNSLTPQVIRFTVDSVIGGAPPNLPPWLAQPLAALFADPLASLLLAAGLVLLIAILAGVCSYFSRVCTAKGAEGFVKRLRDRLFSHIQNLPFSWHVRHQTGDIIQRCTSDVDVVRNFVAGQLLEVFRTSFLILFAMAIMFSMNVKLSLIVLAFIPLVVGYSGVFYALIAKKFRTADEAEGALSSTVQENLTGVRVVRAFGRERFEIDRFDQKNNAFSALWIKLGYVMGFYWGIGDLFTGLQIMTVILAGTVEAVNGALTLGEFMAFISYNATLIWPIRGLGRILSEMSKAGVSIERLNYILDAEEEPDSPGAVRPSLLGDIRFQDVTFGYQGAAPILDKVSFTIPQGSTFAILGGTGSGKSSLMHLLNRLYDLPPDCGAISVGGVDINAIDRRWLRQNVGMVLQEPFLFSQTIGENIRASRPESSMELVRRAADIACVDEAISDFPEGYDTIVGERGVTLSGGQKQRVAIARMLMQQAPIMVFDDSLSAVDSETDSRIRGALRDNLGGSTVVLISHRVTTLMQADTILVLENGRVAELGSHEQLLARDGIYRSIYDIQMNRDDRLFTEQGKGGETNGGL